MIYLRIRVGVRHYYRRLRGQYRFPNVLPGHANLYIVLPLILSVFQYWYPGYGNGLSWKSQREYTLFKNSVFRFAFNKGLVTMYLSLEELLVYNGRCVPNVDMLPSPRVSTFKKLQKWRLIPQRSRLHCPRIISEVVKRESS